MSIFNLYSTVLGDYRDYVRSFFSAANDRAREFIDRELVEQARLWPEALLRVSPSCARVASPAKPSACSRKKKSPNSANTCTRRLVLEAWDALDRTGRP